MPRWLLDVLQIAIYFLFSVDHVANSEDTEMMQMSHSLCWKLSNVPYMCQSSCKQTETVRSSADSWKLAMTSLVGTANYTCPCSGHGDNSVADGRMVWFVKCRRHMQVCRGGRPQSPHEVRVSDSTDDGEARQTALCIYCHIDCCSPSRAAAAIAAASRGHICARSRWNAGFITTTVCRIDFRGCQPAPRTSCPNASSKIDTANPF